MAGRPGVLRAARARLVERQRRRIGAFRDRGVQLAVSDVRAVSAFEHLQRVAAVRHLDGADDALRRLARRSLGARQQHERPFDVDRKQVVGRFERPDSRRRA
jgi:hypothetical protein